MKKTIFIIFLLSITTLLFAWVPSDFALLTWSMEENLGKPIADALNDDYQVIVDESQYSVASDKSGHLHTYELIIIQGPQSILSLPKARVFLYIKDSVFDDQYSDEILDGILLKNNEITAKIGCTGMDEELVKKIKEVITNFDFNKYRAYEL